MNWSPRLSTVFRSGSPAANALALSKYSRSIRVPECGECPEAGSPHGEGTALAAKGSGSKHGNGIVLGEKAAKTHKAEAVSHRVG